MNQRLTNWQQELDGEAVAEYNALRRSLQRNQGFGLFFVQCSPATGTSVIAEIQQDIKGRKIATLKLEQPIDSLYNEIVAISNIEDVEILFISGLEHSLLAYEENTFGNSEQKTYTNSQERYTQSWRGVPRFLGYLNLQRDRFRDNLPISLVFLVPIFGIEYFIKRAPDFFDWRSGFFRFIPDKNQVINSDFTKIFQQNITQSRQELLDLKALSKELDLDDTEQAKIAYKQFFLLIKCEQYAAAITAVDRWLIDNKDDSAWYLRGITLGQLGRYEDAVASSDRAIAIKPDHDSPWYLRGTALVNLGRYEDAVASYDRAIAIKPDHDSPWYNRGNALVNLGRYEDAVASYDRAIAINPDHDSAWYLRGTALVNLGRYEDAVASSDRAIAIKPDHDSPWYNRGNALVNLGRYEDAVASSDRAIAIKPDHDSPWHNRGTALVNLGRYEDAVASYDKAIAINPDHDSAWHNRGNALVNLGRYEEAVASYDRAIAINPDKDEAWDNRGLILVNLGKLDDALISHNQALKFNPDNSNAWYNRACCLALLNQIDLAIESLAQAISLNQEYQALAKTDADFDNIRKDKRFQYLLHSSTELTESKSTDKHR